MTHSFELVLIGGGTAALAAVSEALDLGVSSVALIEARAELGGECALNACVPTKTLLTAAKLMKLFREQAPQYGFESVQYRFNFQRLMQKEAEVIQAGSTDFLSDPRLTVFQGEATFVTEHLVRVNETEIYGEKIIIATGSEPRIPDNIVGIHETDFITFQQATHLPHLPESLIIIGGGPVGVEFAYLFGYLGCKVTLLERDTRLLKHEEPEISKAIRQTLEREGIELVLGCDFKSASRQGDLKAITFGCEGTSRTVQAQELLVAIGMKPRFEKLDPDKAGITYTPKGITVDDELRTNKPHIWAVGDVIGHYEFTHTADYEAVLAARNALRAAHQKTDYWGIGWAIHTIPVAAHVQYTETEAREKYPNLVVLRQPAEAVSRYRIESETDGFIKILVDADTDQLVGGHLYAVNADDIAHLLMLAVRRHMTVGQLLDLIYIYPSRAQIVQKALESYADEKAKAAANVPSQTPVHEKSGRQNRASGFSI